jgi:drug/metabolite transporter (DMT)-like permease
MKPARVNRGDDAPGVGRPRVIFAAMNATIGMRGLSLALATLVCWSISPFFFTNMGKRVGPFTTNTLRLSLAFTVLAFLVAACALAGIDMALPRPATWFWLVASGSLGLAVGDAFLYQAFVTLGPERTSQVQTLAPAATAAVAWLFLKEYLTLGQSAGMGLILAGVFLATTSAARRKMALLTLEARSEGAILDVAEPAPPSPSLSLSLPQTSKAGNPPWTGMMAAIWSALFQGVGTVMARQAFLGQADLHPLVATAIRIGSGAAVLWIYARVRGPLGPVLGAWRAPEVLRLLLAGTLFGPLAGMLCYLGSLKYAPAGVVTTITFMAPLLIIPIGAGLYGTRITAAAIWGTLLSVAGVTLLGLG